ASRRSALRSDRSITRSERGKEVDAASSGVSYNQAAGSRFYLMSTEIKKEIQLEIAHVLFIDIVGYSKLSINEQHAAIEELNQIVRASEQFQRAEAASRLFKVPSPNEAQSANAPGGDDDSVARARSNHRWHRNVFPLSRAIDPGCAGKKYCGASV